MSGARFFAVKNNLFAAPLELCVQIGWTEAKA
jgi:hypothetical protein